MSTLGSDASGTELLHAPSAALEGMNRPPAQPSIFSSPVGGGFAAGGPDVLHGGFDQTWLYHCLRRRWLMALLMGTLVGAGLALYLMWLFPPTSLVIALLEVKGENANPMTGDNVRYIPPQVAEKDALSQMALIRSGMVLYPALKKQNISQLDAVLAHKGEEIQWLSNELKVTFASNSNVLELRYEGAEDPYQMEKLIDEVIESYKTNVLTEQRQITNATLDDLQAVNNENKTKLQKLRELFKEKALAAGILQQDVEIPTLRSEITMLERQIEDAKKVLVDIEVMKNLAVEGARSPAALEQAVQMEIDRDPIIVGSKQSIFELEQAINAQQSRGRNPNNSQLKRLAAQHQQAIGMMEQNRAGIEKGIRDKLSKIPNEGLRQTMMEYRIRFESTQANLKEYTDKLEVADKRLKTLGIKDPELEMLASEIEDLQVNVSEVEQKITMFNVKKTTQERNEVEGKKSDFEKVRVMAPAANQGVTNAIERWIVAGTGGLAGLALTCYGVALMEFRRRKLNQPTDMDEGLGVRVLGVLPPTTLKALASKSLVATQVAEAIDNVRVTLMHGAGAQRRKIVMIASPESMEGTTTVAASLALSLARSGRRTLLVDADLRSPSVHRLFGMSLEDGLSEVLRTQADLVDAIRPANNDNLYVLTAGAGDQVAVGALATDQPQAIFDKLRDQFDFVIVDAPPILGVSDSMSLGKHVDGVILTVLRDHSGVAAIHKSLEMLRSLGIRVIGTVVNGVPMKADRRVVRLHQSSGDLPKIAAKSAAE